MEELPRVLWAYRETARTSIGETPCSLLYESEALILVEIREPSLRFAPANRDSNNDA